MMKFFGVLALVIIAVSADFTYVQPDWPCAFEASVRNSRYSNRNIEFKAHGRYFYVMNGSTVTLIRPDITRTDPGSTTPKMAKVTPGSQKCKIEYVNMDTTVQTMRNALFASMSEYSNRAYKNKEQKEVDGKTCDCYYDDSINTLAVYVCDDFIYRIVKTGYFSSNITINYTWSAPMTDFQFEKGSYYKCSTSQPKLYETPSIDYANCPSSSSSIPTPSSSSQTPSSSSQTPASSSQTPASSSQTPASSSQTPASSSQTPASSSQTPASSSQTPASSSPTPASSSHTPIVSSSNSGAYTYVQPQLPCAFELTVTTTYGGSSNKVYAKAFGRYLYDNVGLVTTVSRPDIHKKEDGTEQMAVFSTWTGDCSMTYGDIDSRVESFMELVEGYTEGYNKRSYMFKEQKKINNRTCDCYYDDDPNTEAVYVYEDFIYFIHTTTSDMTFEYTWGEPDLSYFKFDKDETPECEEYDDRIYSTPSKDYAHCGTPVSPSHVSSLNSSAKAEAMLLAVLAVIVTSFVALF